MEAEYGRHDRGVRRNGILRDNFSCHCQGSLKVEICDIPRSGEEPTGTSYREMSDANGQSYKSITWGDFI